MRTVIIPILVLFSTAQASVNGDLDLPPFLSHGRNTANSYHPLEGKALENAPHIFRSVSDTPSSSYGIPPRFNDLRQYPAIQGSAVSLGRAIHLGRTVTQHFHVVNKVGIPVAQPVPVPVNRNVPVPVPHPVDVPVDRPYPVHVPVKVPWKVYKDIPYPVEKRIYIPVDKVYSKIHVHVPHKIYHYEPVPFKVWKKVPVPVPDPVLVPRPVPVAIRTYLETLPHGDLRHHHHVPPSW